MSEKRDVIISGAGPAGAATAAMLAQKGYDVLLLDRQPFPRDKVCGDAVPAGAVSLLRRMGMADKIETAESEGKFYPLHSLRIISPRGYEMRAELGEHEDNSRSYVAPRMHFDAAIQAHAVDSGAEFRVGQVKEPLQENGRVIGVTVAQNGTTQDILAKVVVGADGVTSPIARTLRPAAKQHKDLHRAVALRAYIDDLEEHPGEVEFYLYKDILPGYAWIFPTGPNQANIGLGMRLDHFRQRKENLKSLLQEFLDMPAIKQRLKRGGQLRDLATWQLNFGSQKKLQHVFDGAILVGDAAGFINPLTGGGIHNALMSAEAATQTIHESLQANDTSRSRMKIYEQRVHDAMWDSMGRAFRMQKWFLRLPILVDLLVSQMRGKSSLAKMFLTKL
ncbi:MAG: NAD(P)/FAD-dependent oxidoreductase [Chloroflexota bacterium]|jgi:menaquinone-9 beta-reductase